MSHDFTRENERQRKQAEKQARRQFRADARALFADESSRRLVFQFLQAMGIDQSPFHTNSMTQSSLIGRQDAARWWLNLIRDACPEREAQMRAEAAKAAKRTTPIEDSSDDD